MTSSSRKNEGLEYVQFMIFFISRKFQSKILIFGRYFRVFFTRFFQNKMEVFKVGDEYFSYSSLWETSKALEISYDTRKLERKK